MGSTTAAKENLKKANLARSIKLKKKKFAEFDRALKHLENKIDLEVERQVTKQLKTVDRKLLKNEIFKVFERLGGANGMLKWAKDHKKEYYKMVIDLLKAEKESGHNPNTGVQVNFLFGNKREAFDITPNNKENPESFNVKIEDTSKT